MRFKIRWIIKDAFIVAGLFVILFAMLGVPL